MAKIIFKSRYLKAGGGRVGNYIKYIATRDGVVKIEDSWKTMNATHNQQKFIKQLMRDFPSVKDSFEYRDYLKEPTRATASEFISAAIDSHVDQFAKRENYVEYIAKRPRVEKQGTHGLFSGSNEPIALSKATKKVADHDGNVWTNIISLRREDAARLNYDKAESWQNLLRSHAQTFAEQMKIPLEDLRWYAAFHNESHHPHCHVVAYSKGKEPYLSKQGIDNIRSALAKDIFAQDNMQTYKEQTKLRDTLTTESRQNISEIVELINDGEYYNPTIEELLITLADRLDKHKGKKVYGYLNEPSRNLVNSIVDELAKDERIGKLYDLWCEQRENVLKTYRDKMPERIPLSQIKEFKAIKNAVIKEASNILFYHEIADQEIKDDFEISNDLTTYDAAPDLFVGQNETDIMDEPEAIQYHADWSDKYKKARNYLFSTNDVEKDFNAAYELMQAEAETGNAYALYDIGRMHMDGLGREKDMEIAQSWFAKAYSAFLITEQETEKNGYLQFRLGKMNAQGLGIEQNYESAAGWYEKAVAQDNPYAAYALGGLHYRGQGVEKSYERASRLYLRAALHEDRPNIFAMYELGKMYQDGIGVEIDTLESDYWFKESFEGFVLVEQKTKDDKLQYRLGHMCLTGTGTSVNLLAAQDYFEQAANLGNKGAMYCLGKLYLNEKFESLDINKAIDWLTMAAKEDHECAQYTLGKLFIEGEAVKRDVDSALQLLHRSAEHGNQYAQILLGQTYLKGELVQQDLIRAEYMLELATRQDNTNAQYALAKMHLNGQAQKSNIFKATSLLEASAKGDHEWAQYTLGKLFTKGEVIPKDIIRAEKFLLASVRPRRIRGESGGVSPSNQYAQHLLGELYLSEDGTLKDIEKAVYYLNQSAEQGNEWAQYTLGKLLLYGNEVERDVERGIELLKQSFGRGNIYARQIMQNYVAKQNNIKSNARFGVAISSVRLLVHLARLIKNRIDDDRGHAEITDRKLRSQIDEKKQAQGLKM